MVFFGVGQGDVVDARTVTLEANTETPSRWRARDWPALDADWWRRAGWAAQEGRGRRGGTDGRGRQGGEGGEPADVAVDCALDVLSRGDCCCCCCCVRSGESKMPRGEAKRAECGRRAGWPGEELWAGDAVRMRLARRGRLRCAVEMCVRRGGGFAFAGLARGWRERASETVRALRAGGAGAAGGAQDCGWRMRRRGAGEASCWTWTWTLPRRGRRSREQSRAGGDMPLCPPCALYRPGLSHGRPSLHYNQQPNRQLSRPSAAAIKALGTWFHNTVQHRPYQVVQSSHARDCSRLHRVTRWSR
ncbi:hypothetical protein DFH27DRAFT_636722 [Peziza echinospora]|nr:hypothetical protein DFH27DRAFT_636722 [Peziza echinospora]